MCVFSRLLAGIDQLPEVFGVDVVFGCLTFRHRSLAGYAGLNRGIHGHECNRAAMDPVDAPDRDDPRPTAVRSVAAPPACRPGVGAAGTLPRRPSWTGSRGALLGTPAPNGPKQPRAPLSTLRQCDGRTGTGTDWSEISQTCCVATSSLPDST